MQEEYHIFFPKVSAGFESNTVTFSINNMKCNDVCIVFYILHCYNLQGNEILVNYQPLHIGNRWIVDNVYSPYYDTYEISSTHLHNIHQIQIELVIIGVNDNNPLRFNQVMFANKEYDGVWHKPDEEMEEANIGFNKNRFINLYTNSTENYLQVIRPYGDAITTKKLTKSQLTVIAPHLEHEPEIDNPTNLLMEFYNQNEQETTIHNDGFKM